MVSSEVWHDLIDSEYFEEIYAYGDEKQLPPIEDYNKLELRYRPYYRFWHEFKDPENVTTLKINYRQQGDLKTFVETIENNLFSNLHSTRIPTPLYQGNNFSVHSTDIKEDELLEAIMTSDIIITPYNKVRQLVNNIRRKQQARIKKMPFSPLPVVGDKIIFVDAVKKETTQGKYTFKTIYLAKNVNAVITNISDISVTDNLMIADIIDETGKHHFNMSLSLNTIVGITTSSGVARIDYAYAVTVHSSQGGQWNNVLFLDGHWPGEDASKLRYVGITRAQQFLSIVCGIMNTTESKDADRSIIIRLSQLVK
jgi:prepilin-type processing-associated H-X9-DG protein